MGAKSFFEKCLGVEFGPHSFKSGIPRVMVPGCVLMFVAVFLIVVGILLCGVHAAYEVSRVDDTYEDYFLIAGIIAMVIGIIIALVGTVWCCHVRSHLKEEMQYYHDTKLTRSASIRSNIDASELASISHSTVPPYRDGAPNDRESHTSFPPNQYPPPGHNNREMRESHASFPQNQYPPPGHNNREMRENHASFPPNQYPPPGHNNGSYYGENGNQHWRHTCQPEPYPGEVALPQRHEQPREGDAATRINNSINRGVRNIKGFVARNKDESSRRNKNKVPYSDRMPSYPGPDPNGMEPGEDEENDDGNFNLARTYKQPEPRYYTEQNPPDGHEDEFGYANIPDTANAHLPRGQRPGSASQPQTQGKKDKGSKKRGQSETVVAETYDEPNEPNEPRKPNADAYRYNQGRPPLDSSVDSTGEKEKTTLVYNPKDGQWYYYYRGRPVSLYTGNNPEKDANEGPMYRYINGKPVLVTKSTESLDKQGKEKSKQT